MDPAVIQLIQQGLDDAQNARAEVVARRTTLAQDLVTMDATVAYFDEKIAAYQAALA